MSEKEREMSGESPDRAGGRVGSSCSSSLTFLILGEGTISGESVPDRCTDYGVLSSAQSIHHESIVITITIVITEVPTS